LGALHPGDRLIHVLDFPEPEAGDQLERPVDDGTAGTIERNTLALRGRLEAVGGDRISQKAVTRGRSF